MNGLRQGIRKDRPTSWVTPCPALSLQLRTKVDAYRLQAAARVHRLPHTRSHNLRGKLQRFEGSGEKPGVFRNQTTVTPIPTVQTSSAQSKSNESRCYAHCVYTPMAETWPLSSFLGMPLRCCKCLLKVFGVCKGPHMSVCI